VAYGIKTSGTILGAVLGGLFILPWLGMHDSIKMAAALYFLVAGAFWLCSTVALSRIRQILVAYPGSRGTGSER
jgi:hypothetical protein